MSNQTSSKILPAEEWAPYFAYFAKTANRKYNDQQIETIAKQGMTSNWCNLCDAPCTSDQDRHVKQHMRDLAAWRKIGGAKIEREAREKAKAAA